MLDGHHILFYCSFYIYSLFYFTNILLTFEIYNATIWLNENDMEEITFMKKKIISIALCFLLLLGVLPVSVFAAEDNFSWPLGQALPSFGEPAAVLDTIELAGRPFEDRLAAACLEGLVNRTQPRLYVKNDEGNGSTFWADDTCLKYTSVGTWYNALVKYSDEIDGIIIWNPEVKETANVATTAAGILGGIAVHPNQLATVNALGLNLPVLLDLRDEPISNKNDAYMYIYNNFWEDCTRRTISGLAPDGHVQLRDFAVAVKSACMWLDAADADDKALLKLFFDDTTPIDTYYTGWWPNEGEGIGFASSYGVVTIPSDFYENYTVFSGMSREITVPTVPAKPELENDKIYVSLNMSDGDNIQYDQHAMRSGRLWGSADRGKVPIGFTASPALLDAGPQLLNYYYRTATENDLLICGPSGLGYSSAENWKDEAFIRKYANITNSYFERSGFNVITVWNNISNQRANWFAEECPSLLGMTAQHRTFSKIRHTAQDTPIIWFGTNLLTFQWAMSYDSGIDGFRERLSGAAEWDFKAPQFFACQASAWATSVTDFVNLVNEMNEKYPDKFVFVRTDHLLMLINEFYGKPINASLQKTATSSSEAAGFEAQKAFDGSFSYGWQAAASGENSLSVDLTEDYKISRYVLKNTEANYGDAENNTDSWVLQVSKDNKNWKDADEVTGNTDAIVYRTLNKAVSGQYARLVVKNPGGDGIARVQELELYGVKSSFYTDIAGFFLRAYEFIRILVTDVVNVFNNIFN